MFLQPILALIILRYLRRSLKTTGLLPKWNRLFIIGTVLFISLIAINLLIKSSRPVVMWIGHAQLLALVYLVYSQKELSAAKPVVNAILPVIGVYLLEDIVKSINADFFHKSLENYFGAAGVFAFVWMGAMIYINNKQRKALEKERLKTEAKEKENKITETLKAALEVQVKERTAELTLQKEELQHALDELKATQSQLIQSEKMASLGELTAGIAHEIKNPLNFVNNFSEVNTELIDEMQQEIAKGNLEDVKAIATDIKDNQQKITFHGKRADDIVKSMLLHSRSSSGQKEPTDINALADEYLRLSYHGLRAKDKSFNATMKTDFDESIGNINIIPQDIGRVILNLINNAFYAASLPSKGGFSDSDKIHDPAIWVSTKKMGDKVLISVRDNGPGIPQTILDKIFQPFFTTKPTGQGTGLGLSLSYDIVKAHGGELKVETKEGEGSEFIIILNSVTL